MNIENIMNPEESFNEYKKYLLKLYADDYGKENLKLINKRMEDTYYLFDSNPIDMMDFYLKHKDEIHDNNLINQVFIEYNNYIKIKNILDDRLNKKYYKILSSYFNISNKFIKEELFDLDIESYSLENTSLLKDENISKEKKEKLLKRREAYINKCYELGIEPIVNYLDISFILSAKRDFEYERDLKLFRKSIWGKRIVKKVRKECPNFSIVKLVDLYRCIKVACTNHLLGEGYILEDLLVFCPVVRNLSYNFLDRVLLHENRHVIESNLLSGGLSLYDPRSKYRLIDEVRTESKAIQDLELLDGNVLWSNGDLVDGLFNPYEELFPYTSDFYEKEKDKLNDFALYGRIEEFESTYGKDALIDFERFLENVDSTNRRAISSDEYDYFVRDEEVLEGKRLVKVLKDNATRNR